MLNKIIHSARRMASAFSKKNGCILYVYNTFARLINGKTFFDEIKKRRLIDIFDYESLIVPLPYYPIEKIKDSNFYGYVYAIKQYMNCHDVEVIIEHGLYLDDNVSFYSKYKTFDTICTLSNFRLDILKKHGVKKQMMAIGPYIHYAEPLLDEAQLSNIKNKLGKVLLYMPSHSTNLINGTSPFFQEETNIVKGFKEKYKFDTVVVCVYYRDFKYKECIADYQAKGFLITTAGHQLDLYFINRLKSIIQLSDYTMSNRIGTNLGYCVYMGKPHIIINDYPGKYSQDMSGYEVRREIADAFKDYHPQLTPMQKDIVNKYWGLDSIKSPEMLKHFFR